MSARSEFDALKNGLSSLAQKGYVSSSEKEEGDAFVAPDNLMFAPVNESGDVYGHEMESGASFESESTYAEEYRPYQDGHYEGVDEEDERLWPGGPRKSEVESWKKQYTDIYIADDIDPAEVFVYRTINRYEYKAIVATPNTDPLMREEMICEQCVLFPYEYSYSSMSNGNAGNVSTLAEQILTMSGFVKNSIPRRL